MNAMPQMKKLDIAKLQQAAAGFRAVPF